MQWKYFVLAGVLLLGAGCTANRTAETPERTYANSSSPSPVESVLVTKEYRGKSMVVSLKLPSECNLIEQPRDGQFLFSLTSDNGKNTTCRDNINLAVQSTPVSEKILDEQVEESTASPNTMLGIYTGTWYEGKTAEGGGGYTFDYISNGKNNFWLGYMIYPRLGHESEFNADIEQAREHTKQIISSMEFSPLVR